MKKLALVLSFLTLLATSAIAAPVLNQASNNGATPSDAHGWSWVNPYHSYGTRFTANTASLNGAGVYFSAAQYWPVNPNATVTISLYNSAANVLASGSFTNATSGWNDVFFNDVATTIGENYYVFATSNMDDTAVITYRYDSAMLGYALLNNGGIQFFNNNYSIDARIYTNDGASEVPEPGPLSLLGIALLALFAFRQRNRAC